MNQIQKNQFAKLLEMHENIKTIKSKLKDDMQHVNEMYYEIVKKYEFLPAKERYYLKIDSNDKYERKIDYPYLYANNCKKDYSTDMMFTSPYNIKVTSKYPKACRIWRMGEAEKEDKTNLEAIEFFKTARIVFTDRICLIN